jgi:hypothetical protein
MSAFAAAVPASAQDANAPRTRRVVPSIRYDASGIHGFFFGKDHRQLWTTAIDAEVLDLRNFAGGLQPVGTGGGQQTQALRFRAADGRPFTFRSLDKDPSAVLPPDLHGTFAARLIQDQVSSAYPSAPLVVDPSPMTRRWESTVKPSPEGLGPSNNGPTQVMTLPRSPAHWKS